MAKKSISLFIVILTSNLLNKIGNIKPNTSTPIRISLRQDKENISYAVT